MRMCHRLSLLVLCALAALLPRSPALAAGTSLADSAAGLSVPVTPDLGRPASLTHLEPVPLRSVPLYAPGLSTLRTSRVVPLCLEGSGPGEKKGMDRDTEFTLAAVGIGAGVGLTFGLINGHDEGRNMLIGAGVGAGLVAAAYLLAL